MVNAHVKGSTWRREVKAFLGGQGIPTNTRGIGESGDDLWNSSLSLECKNQRAITMATFMDQALHNAGDRIAAVIIKRRQKPTSQAYVVLTLRDFSRLVVGDASDESIWYSCPRCGDRFQALRTFRHHMEEAHP